MDSIDIFPWDDNFNTGLPKVDEQHRKLVQLLNILASHVAFKADDFQLSRIFDELAAYAIYHFETEEAIWHDFLADDPAELDHRVTHQSFIEEVSRLKAALGSASEDRLAEEALGFLARWLASHILETDRYMAYTVLALQSGLSRDLAKRQATEQMGGATRALIDIILSIYSTLSTNTLRLMRELAEHRQAEISLRRETEAIRAFLHFASDGIHILDNKGNVVECSDSFSAMLGYGREEVIGMHVRNWDAGFNDAELLGALRQLLESPTRSQFETRHRRKDGSVFDVEISGYPLQIGERQLLFCASRDITERKQLDRRLVESEANLRTFFNTIDDFLFVLDGNGSILQTNRIVNERLGYAETELLGQSVLFVHPPDCRAEAQQIIADMLDDKCDYCPVPLQARNGQLIPVETRVVPGQWNGSPALFGVSRDVTQQLANQQALKDESRVRRQLLDELKEREFFLRQSQQIGKLGGWRADPTKNTVTWTEGVYEIVEMPVDFYPDFKAGLDFYLPESRDRVVENLKQTLHTGEPFSIQVQIRGNRSGDIKWTQLRGLPHHKEDGSVDYLMGTLQDITEQKRIDQVLQQSVAFNDSLIETMVDGIAVCHFISEPPFVRFTLWNQAMQALTGYSLEEINQLGWYQTVYVDPNVQDAARQRMERMRQGDNLDREEWVIACKNGEQRTVEISTLILDRTDGEPNVMAIMRDVTSRKRDEELLRSSSQYVRSLIEASLDPLVTISPEGKIDDVNQATEVVTGVDRDQLVGSDFSSYFTEPDKARTGYLKVFEEGQVVDYPLAIRHINGRITEVLYNATVYRNADGSVGGVFAAARDITERTRTELALRESEHRFRDYSIASSDWFWETDNELRFSYFSEKAEEVLGTAPQHLLGRRREEVASSDDLADGKWTEHLDTLAQHKPFRNFEYHVRRDFGGRWFSISGVPHFDAEGRFKGYRGIGSNITSRKEAEQQLAAALEAAQAANVAKSRFLATMSHEIRTPLNGILGMAQILLMPQLKDSERQDYARTILNSGQTLLTLLNDILDLSKVEAGRLDLELTAFEPAQLIHETKALFLEAAHKKNLLLEASWSGLSRRRYLGDTHRLRQMLSNLVGNAIKFTSSGRVSIEVREVGNDDERCVLEFSVEDTGIGIPQDSQAMLFRPFSQADSSTTRQFGGTGLGLSIVRNLAKLMDGDVWIESKPGHGSRFGFRVKLEAVPLGLDTRDVNRASADLAQLAADPITFIGHVLVVEDNPNNSKVIQALLLKLGLEVTLAADGQQSLGIIQQGGKIDLVLMDIQMPVMDGYAATRSIRQWESEHKGIHLPIVALTANAFAEDRQCCLSAGMDDFLPKPISVAALTSVLTRWLKTAAATFPATRPVKRVPVDAPSVITLLRKILPLLVANRFDAIEQFQALQEVVAGTTLEEDVAEVGQHLEHLLFVQALDRLRKLAQRNGWEI
jgi:hemerythrin-like metal-binding protein/PAS domain S-box-containing protein